MSKRTFPSMWISFIWSIFLVLFITNAVAFLLTVYLTTNHIVDLGRPGPPPMFLSLLASSIVIGTCVTIIVGRKIIGPISGLGKAMQKVAKGDFSTSFQIKSNVTEIRGLAANFNLMTQELAGIETLRSDFVVNVSHEFKTPLAAIEGYASLLQDEDISKEERVEYAKMIMDSTRRLSALSGNILRISKLENQEVIAKTEKFALDEQIRQVLLFLEPSWSGKELELDIELNQVFFFGDEELLLQVWFNLLENAIKFTPEGGILTVRLTREGEFVQVVIADTGIGMTQEEQNHIFEKFYQAERERGTVGNGLGLALVKRILDLSGGTIKVESSKGEGTSFFIRLPKEGH